MGSIRTRSGRHDLLLPMSTPDALDLRSVQAHRAN
jgi:hypothetical protein